MKYFVVNGYIPEPHPPKVERLGSSVHLSETSFSRHPGETRAQRTKRYKDAGLAVPELGLNTFLECEGVGSISVFVFDTYEALFLIKSVNQGSAYLLANALRGYLTVVHGLSVFDDQKYFLSELISKPDPDMTIADIANLVKPMIESQPIDRDLLQLDLRSGLIISHFQIEEACRMIKIGLKYPLLLEAFQHLEYSYSLVWGFMTGSYYELHYAADRAELSEYELEKLYYEDRIRFDLAFLSAFRGIETILGKPFLREHDIEPGLTKLDKEFGTRFQTDEYWCLYEMFSGEQKIQSYSGVISRFLVLRNSVAAHANPRSPKIIIQDQVLEIQLLLKEMLVRILEESEEER